MDVSFNCIAFQLKFSSNQIDSVYSLLDLHEAGDQKIPVFILKQQIAFDLPEKFRKWVEQADENINIIFEQRVMSSQKVCFNDWDLIDY